MKDKRQNKKVNDTKKTVEKNSIKNKNKVRVGAKKDGKVVTKGKMSKLEKIKDFVKKYKNFLLFGILFITDIILIICFARENYANYANVKGKIIFVGKTKHLLFGRNYVGLIVTLFIYLYGVLVSKVWFKNKFTIRKLILLFIGIFLVNILLFYLFTNKIY